MPRLSLYRPNKSQDYKFIDRSIYEMFQIGGVDVYVHKYIGPVDPSDPSKALGVTSIQDVLFLENRDRKYEESLYTIRGHFQVQDIDFNLSQFGLFLQNDTVFMTVHINNSVDLLGRKIMSGDVLELPNLEEEYTFDRLDETNFQRAIKKYYVIEDVTRAAEGFSATWYPHLYRLKLKPLTDSQEFGDILNRPVEEDVYAGVWSEFEDDGITPKVYYPGQVVRWNGDLYVVKDSVGPEGTTIQPPNTIAWDPYSEPSIKDILSTYNKELEINNAIIAEAESDAPLSGYETSHFYTLSVNDQGQASLNAVNSTLDNIANNFNISNISSTPIREGYSGYLLGDGVAPNGPMPDSAMFGFGIQFPKSPRTGDTFLRTDFLPNRMFRYDGSRWIKQEDNVRMTMTNTDTRQTWKTSFINNTEISGITRLPYGSDTFNIDSSGNPVYAVQPQFATVSVVQESPGVYYVLTQHDYNPEYKVEVWIGEETRAPHVTAINDTDKFAFRIEDPVRPNTDIRYTIYSKAVEQRQSLSKALRKLSPTADE